MNALLVLTLLLGERSLGAQLIDHGASIVAVPLLRDARDRALRAVGEHDPRLAPFDDALAAALRARGRIREAMRYHRESIALDETPVALLARARTEIEGGELRAAFGDVQRAQQLGGDVSEVLAEAIDAARDVPEWASGVPLIVPALPAAEARATRRTLPADADPALAVRVAEGLRAGGDDARDVLTHAAAQLGNEPTRTALRVYIALARTGNVQAARAAIAVYQALPELARSYYDEMWDLTTH